MIASGNTIEDAIAFHRQGRIAEAEAIYHALLLANPENADALHLLGVLCYQNGDYLRAIDMIGRAIRINDNVAIYHYNLGTSLQATNKFYLAVSSFERAISLNPEYSQAYCNRGAALSEINKLRSALTSCERAIELQSDYALAHFNRGNILKKMNKPELALSSYDLAISLIPNYSSAYCNKGIALLDLNNFEAALAIFDRAIALKPDFAEAYCNRGIALLELKQQEAALVSFDTAIALRPDYAEAFSNRGIALHEMKQFEQAVSSFDRAIVLSPNYAEALYNRGNALTALRKLDAAVSSYKQAIALKPANASFHLNLGYTLNELNESVDAIASYDKAIELNPAYYQAYSNRAITLQQLKKLDVAVNSFDAAYLLNPHHDYLIGMRQHAKMSICEWRGFELNVAKIGEMINEGVKAAPCIAALALPLGLPLVRKAAEVWISDKFPYNSALGPIFKKSRESKIRVGYYSADFHFHPVSLLTVGLFEHHDKSEFEIIAFSMGPQVADAMRARLQNAFDKFIDIRSKSDQEVAELSRAMGIDIAVDLGGHTQGCRTGIFSFRVAPVQISYIGYLGTMGASYYDYLIADKVLVPVKSRPYYIEKIIYLPSYQVNDCNQEISVSHPEVISLSLPSGAFVYCCFNANYKITPRVFDVWMRILISVPNSVLLIYSESERTSETLRAEAEARGVKPNRLIFDGRLTRSEYLDRCKVADLFLDTWPYNAGATASDALWVGLPILTCMGDTFSSRVAGSILHALDMGELVTETPEEYENLAIELANNRKKIELIKEKIGIKRRSSLLFDTLGATKNIESAYKNILGRYYLNLPPDHIFIT